MDKNLTVYTKMHLTFLVLIGFPFWIPGNHFHRLTMKYTPSHPLSFMFNHSTFHRQTLFSSYIILFPKLVIMLEVLLVPGSVPGT